MTPPTPSIATPSVAPAESAEPAPWTLYLLECRSGALYTGITNNLEARYQAHLSGKGAKYTRANPPVAILATAEFPDRSSASKAEWAIKQQPRHRKVEAVLEFGVMGAGEELGEENDLDVDGTELDEERCS